MTAYNPRTPKDPNESVAEWQEPFLINFQQMFSVFAQNHVPFDGSSIAGNHNIVELLRQQSFQTSTSEIATYTKEVEGQGDQLFLRYQGNGQEFQYSNYQIYSVTPQNNQTPFFTFLPGKLIMCFGSFTNPLPENKLKLFPPVIKNIVTVSFVPNNNFSPTTTSKPKILIEAAVNGFIPQIIVKGGQAANINAPSCYYMVLGNL